MQAELVTIPRVVIYGVPTSGKTTLLSLLNDRGVPESKLIDTDHFWDWSAKKTLHVERSFMIPHDDHAPSNIRKDRLKRVMHSAMTAAEGGLLVTNLLGPFLQFKPALRGSEILAFSRGRLDLIAEWEKRDPGTVEEQMWIEDMPLKAFDGVQELVADIYRKALKPGEYMSDIIDLDRIVAILKKP